MSNEQQVRIYNPSEASMKNAAVSGMEAYRALCKEAEDDYEGYWARNARELLDWKVPFTQVLDESNAPFFKWFADGKLNVSYNCLDRQVNNGLGDKVAIIFEADSGEVTRVTYKDLLGRVSKFANALRAMASRRATASSSTCRCRSKASLPCRPAPVSVRPIRSCSVASPPRRCVTASATPVRWR